MAGGGDVPFAPEGVIGIASVGNGGREVTIRMRVVLGVEKRQVLVTGALSLCLNNIAVVYL